MATYTDRRGGTWEIDYAAIESMMINWASTKAELNSTSVTMEDHHASPEYDSRRARRKFAIYLVQKQTEIDDLLQENGFEASRAIVTVLEQTARYRQQILGKYQQASSSINDYVARRVSRLQTGLAIARGIRDASAATVFAICATGATGFTLAARAAVAVGGSVVNGGAEYIDSHDTSRAVTTGLTSLVSAIPGLQLAEGASRGYRAVLWVANVNRSITFSAISSAASGTDERTAFRESIIGEVFGQATSGIPQFVTGPLGSYDTLDLGSGESALVVFVNQLSGTATGQAAGAANQEVANAIEFRRTSAPPDWLTRLQPRTNGPPVMTSRDVQFLHLRQQAEHRRQREATARHRAVQRSLIDQRILVPLDSH